MGDLFEPPGPTSILSADDELGAAIARYVDGVSSMKEPGREGPLLTLLRVHPLTGRTHQIRAHLAHVGCPLVTDLKYNPRRGRQDVLWCPRLFLHCARMELTDLEGQHFTVEAPLPSELQRSLHFLRPCRGLTAWAE